ncbi:hypothetical protein TRFO_24496 [Tritrichomonas foetus]|uniref:Nuclear pore complex protein n=1 Tax=Tritrichomonas foetus TaxID=1144522 RepID=A0A1J4K800_9EUKA|nr:hypothetical protein TRFO_24496 [Tritrichomonas foetus]|eukprot:OHT07331.1 hypothetical protein TRFO_24496 [Tritrichomonas foetus]
MSLKVTKSMNESTMNKEQIRLYAQPLLNKGQKKPYEICDNYYKMLINSNELSDQEEAYIWKLFSHLYDTSYKVPDYYQKKASLNPRIKNVIICFIWLSEIYDFTVPKASKRKNEPFYFLRTNQIDSFLDRIKNENPDEKWKALTFSGAFSQSHFIDWRTTVKTILKNDKINDHEKLYYKILTGDLKTLLSLSENMFDSLWGQLYSLISMAISNEAIDYKLPSKVEPTTNFEKMTFSIIKNVLSNTKNYLLLNDVLPLHIKVHLAATKKGFVPDELLIPYIQLLTKEGLTGLLVFYASLANTHSNSIDILKSTFAALEPSEEFLSVLQQFKFDKVEVVNEIISHLSGATPKNFAEEISFEEFTETKIHCLDWLSLVPEMSNCALENVRKIVKSLVLDDKYDGAKIIFDRYSNMFKNLKERECWKILIYAELAYKQWKASDIVDEEQTCAVKEILKNVIRFPNGWMIDCQGVESDVGKHCIPLIAEHLFDVYMRDHEAEAALGIAPMICDSSNLMMRYFDKNILMKFLMMIKKASIELYRDSQQNV